MKGIILHGGHGTRLRPLTHTGPKQLLPIANKPMSQYCVETLIQAGILEIAFIIGGIGSEKVKEYYGNGEKFGAKFSYVYQDYPKGIAHAISLCEDFINDEKFIVFLGDNIINRKINDYVSNFQKSNAEASILLCEVDNPSQFGVAEINNNKIVKIIEKPKNPSSNLAVTGIYFLTPYIFEIIKKLKPSWRNELEIADALDMLIQENKELIFEIITDYWKDTGTPEDIIHANGQLIEKMDQFFFGVQEDNVKINGKVIVGKNSLIKSDVIINGPVIIGENCLINSGITIGPNVSIGKNSNISKCSLMNSIIMENCKIDLDVNIRNSIVSNNSEIISDNKSNNESVFLLGEGTKIFF